MSPYRLILYEKATITEGPRLLAAKDVGRGERHYCPRPEAFIVGQGPQQLCHCNSELHVGHSLL